MFPESTLPGRKALLYLLLLSGPLVFLFFFFYYPLSSILQGGLTDDQGRFTVSRIGSILSDPYYTGIIWFTVKQAFLSTLLSISLGLPGAYLLAKYDFWGKNVIRALTTIPFVLPSIIVVLGFVRFFGNNGILNRLLMGLFRVEEPPLRILYSMKAILLAHAFYNFPICIRIVSALWSRLDPNFEDAARSMGAHGFRLFREVTLPRILPAILASSALIFIFCLLSFAIVLVLGGGPRFTTLEVEVYRLAKVSLDLKMGSALALIGSFLSSIFLYLYIRLQRKMSFAEEITADFERKRLSALLKEPAGIFFVLYLFLIAALIIAPMAAVVYTSFLKRSGWGGSTAYSLDWYIRLIFTSNLYARSILNSLFFGFMTILFALPLGTLIAYLGSRREIKNSSILESLMMLPMGVSSIMLGLGYIKAFQGFPVEITGSWYAIVLAHTVISYPFVIRSVSSMFRKIKPSLLEAARSLGADSWQLFWHLELPLIKGALITGAAFAFAISIGEINATMMLAGPQTMTIPVAIYRLISSYNFIGACAMGTILMAISFLTFLIIDRVGEGIG